MLDLIRDSKLALSASSLSVFLFSRVFGLLNLAFSDPSCAPGGPLPVALYGDLLLMIAFGC